MNPARSKVSYAVIYRPYGLKTGQWQNKRRWVSMPVSDPQQAVDALRMTMQRPVQIEQVLIYE